LAGAASVEVAASTGVVVEAVTANRNG